MVLLLWLYIKSRIRVYEYAAKILVGLTFISYLMDIYSVVMHEHHAVSTIFLNISGEKKRNVFPNRCSVLILILILLFMTYC